MIYEIISKNDVPTSQMHIYLKNKTGDDGGIYPEVFNDLSISESVNGLYAFAIACVMTDNFTNTSKFLKDYPSKEVATLALIQYIKGVATTVQLNNKCVNPLYNQLEDIKQMGMSPTLLNLDGDLFYKHYDTSKYYSKEAADNAEDSFPYWVINTVKEITECTEIVAPVIKNYELPYYIQNISNEKVPIYDGISKSNNIIGYIPPSGVEPVIEIKNGFGILGTSEKAYVYLTDKVRPIKHVVDLEELNIDSGTLKFPDGEFDVTCKKGCLIVAGHGINNHYTGIDELSYHDGDTIHIKGLFRNAGIIDDNTYVQLHSDCVTIKIPEEHRKKNEILDQLVESIENKVDKEINDPQIFDNCKYLVIIPMASEEVATQAITKILNKSPYNKAYIDIDLDDKVTIVVYGDNESANVIKVKKKILAVFGYKALVIEYDKFYK